LIPGEPEQRSDLLELIDDGRSLSIFILHRLFPLGDRRPGGDEADEVRAKGERIMGQGIYVVNMESLPSPCLGTWFTETPIWKKTTSKGFNTASRGCPWANVLAPRGTCRRKRPGRNLGPSSLTSPAAGCVIYRNLYMANMLSGLFPIAGQ